MTSPAFPADPVGCPTSPERTVRVDLPGAEPRGYDIIIGTKVLAEAGTLIRDRLGVRRCLIISDSAVAELYHARLAAVLAAAGHTLLPPAFLLPGESSKEIATLAQVLDHALEAGLDRQTLLIALGGGVVGDLAGLAASLAMRGVPFVQVPTTLLAQVDSAVGGKTGIDTRWGKNTIGTFYQPALVLTDVTTLDSLPVREMRAGYAEIVKYGLLGDAPFFAWCQTHGALLLRGDREAQMYAVASACRHKARVVAEDEHESTGARALLNLGHTFGHALEAAVGYDGSLRHGEAVAIGMVLAFRLSARLGLCPSNDADLVRAHFESLGLPVAPPASKLFSADTLITLMGHDKKARHGALALVLAHGIGQAFLANDVPVEEVRAVWTETMRG